MLSHELKLKEQAQRIAEDKKDKLNKHQINGIWYEKGQARNSFASSSSSSSSSSALTELTKRSNSIEMMGEMRFDYLLKELAPVFQYFM